MTMMVTRPEKTLTIIIPESRLEEDAKKETPFHVKMVMEVIVKLYFWRCHLVKLPLDKSSELLKFHFEVLRFSHFWNVIWQAYSDTSLTMGYGPRISVPTVYYGW